MLPQPDQQSVSNGEAVAAGGSDAEAKSRPWACALASVAVVRRLNLLVSSPLREGETAWLYAGGWRRANARAW